MVSCRLQNCSGLIVVVNASICIGQAELRSFRAGVELQGTPVQTNGFGIASCFS